MSRPTLRRLLVAALLIGAGLFTFARLTLNPTAILVGPQRGGLNDLTDYFLPQTEYKIAGWREHGKIPTWDPHLQLGRPIVGNPQSAIYYPATWLMILTGNAYLASWLLVAHHVLGGWGMYLLCRRYGCARPAAIVGGLAFLAAPSLVAHTAEGHFTMTCAAAWVPWALLAYERLRLGRPYATVLLAAVLAIAFFAGHAQTVYYLVLVLCGFVVADVVRGLKVGLADSAHPTAKLLDPKQLATNFLLAGVLTAALVAIDLLPIWATSQQSTRAVARMTATRAGDMQMGLSQLQQFVYPFALGSPEKTQAGWQNYWETLLYVGLLPLILAICGAAMRLRDYPTGRYLALFLVVLLFSFGTATPFYTLLHQYLPGMSNFRVPARAMLLGSAAIAVLAAGGCDAILARCQRFGESRTGIWKNLAAIVAVVAIAGVAIELSLHAWAVTHTLAPARLRTASGLTKALAGSSSTARVLAARGLLSDGEAYRHDIARVRGYDPMLMWRHLAMLNAVFSQRQPLPDEAEGKVTEPNLDYQQPALNLLGVRYAALPAEATSTPANWKLVEQGQVAPRIEPTNTESTRYEQYFLYENGDALPRAFVIGRTVAAKVLDGVDLSTTLVVPPGAPAGSEEQPLAPATIVEYQPARVVIDAELTAPGYVVLSDLHAAGWRATVGGRPAPLVPVDIGLRGVPLVAGRHRVEMTFTPPRWTQGLIISLAALAGIVMLAALERRRNASTGDKVASPAPKIAASATVPPPPQPAKPSARPLTFAAGQRWSLLAAIVVLLAARLWQIAAFEPRMSDTGVYFGYVVQSIDGGRTAFRDFAIEYPPVAYWTMAAPRFVDGHRLTNETSRDKAAVQRSYQAYATAYRLLMLAVELAAVALLAGYLMRRRPDAAVWAVWTYVIAATLLVHVVLDRLDMVLWAMIIGWLYLRSRAATPDALENKLSYLLLGLSIAFKLVTIVMVPLVLLADWQRTGRQAKPLVTYFVWGLCGLVIPFALHYPSAGLSTLKFLGYHGARGIEVESTYATFIMALRPVGLDVSTKSAFGSIDVESTLSPWLARGSTWLLLAALGGIGLWSLRRGRNFTAAVGEQAALVALLMTLLLSKVLSAQFFVFAIPIIIVLAAELLAPRWRLAISAIVVAIAALTTAIFPYLWFSIDPNTGAAIPYGLVPGLHPLSCGLLMLRNGLFVGVVAWLAVRLYRAADKPAAETLPA